MQINSVNGISSLKFHTKKNDVQRKVNQNNYFQFSSCASNAIKNNSLSLINFCAKKEESIESIVQKLKKEYGVNAEFESLTTAQMTLSAIEDYVKLNDKNMFEGLVIKPYEEDVDWLWGARSDYNTGEFVLRLNNKMSMEDIEQKAQDDYDNCGNASNKSKYDFYVALGEYLSFKYNPYIYVVNSKKSNYSSSFLKIAQKMCSTSTLNFARFNSNYIAAKMCGAEVPPGAKEYYYENGGPSLNFPPAKITKNPFENKLQFNSIEEAVEYLKQYDIQAEFDNLKVANLTANAIEDFIQINENPKMFKGLKITTGVTHNIFNVGSMCWGYNYLDKEIEDCYIRFNKAHDWGRHKGIGWKNYFAGHYASFDEKYSIYHELAHWLDFQSRPEQYSRTNDAYKSGEIHVNELGKMIFGRVSGYAQNTSIEFVAEYIASRMCGLEFPEMVNSHYKMNTPLKLKFPS